jgi:hypothetical protein
MALKIFGPGGTDQKSNDLLRNPRDLRDSLNIKYSINQEYEKRPGTEVDTDFSGDTYSDVIFIKSLGEYFFRNGTEYYSYKNGIKRQIYKFADPLISGNSNISLAEYLNITIFTHEENQVFTAKYDGSSIYRAGLPTPTITGFTAGAYFLLSFYKFIDSNGNTVYGPATITPNVQISDNVTPRYFTTTTLKDTGFYAGYLKVSITSGFDIDINEISNTIDYTSISPDIEVGSKIPYGGGGQGFNTTVLTISTGLISSSPTVFLEVEAIDTGLKTITFKFSSYEGYRLKISSPTTGLYNISKAVVICYYISTSETTGYYGLFNQDAYPHLDNTATTATIEIRTDFGLFKTRNLLSNIYDITTSKLRPPKCKYLSTFGDQIVCAPVLSFWDFNNKEITYTNNDLVMYSDVFTGDLGENFSESNRQLIGDSYDGQITGLVRAKDSLIVFKNNAPYAIDGILVQKLYSMRKIETNEIGCSSNKSILIIDGSILFQGVDGIYAISGNSAKKYSTKIDPFFAQSSFDPSLTRSVMDVLNENYYFFTNLGVVVFNFEFKQWFIWDLVNAPNGLTVDNNQKIKMFNGAVATQFINESITPRPACLNDSGVAINAWIKTAWFDFGEPSLLKKFVDIRFFSLRNLGQTLLSRLYRDWDETKVKADFSIDMSLASTKTVLRKLDIQQAQSVSLFIGNNAINEDINLSGFELNGGVAQEKDKNVK